jgi:hypothetical protein
MQTRGGEEAAAGSRPSDAAPAAADRRRSTGPWRRRGGSTRIAPGRSPATRDPGAGGQGEMQRRDAATQNCRVPRDRGAEGRRLRHRVGCDYGGGMGVSAFNGPRFDCPELHCGLG